MQVLFNIQEQHTKFSFFQIFSCIVFHVQESARVWNNLCVSWRTWQFKYSLLTAAYRWISLSLCISHTKLNNFFPISKDTKASIAAYSTCSCTNSSASHLLKCYIQWLLHYFPKHLFCHSLQPHLPINFLSVNRQCQSIQLHSIRHEQPFTPTPTNLNFGILELRLCIGVGTVGRAGGARQGDCPRREPLDI